jgi:membrane protein implicated in regulation of membrane protease activity
MIVSLIEQFGPWAWIIAGLLFLGLEIVAPGNIFVWFGLAAILTGVAAFLAGLGWQLELLIFCLSAVAFVLLGRRAFSRESSPGERPFLNDRSRRLVGQSYVLAEPIVNGRGKIRVDDTNWRVFGPDLPSGTRVRVAAADGTLLTVEPVE